MTPNQSRFPKFSMEAGLSGTETLILRRSAVVGIGLTCIPGPVVRMTTTHDGGLTETIRAMFYPTVVHSGLSERLRSSAGSQEAGPPPSKAVSNDPEVFRHGAV